MKRIVIYRHPECGKCARMARVRHLCDWFNRVAVVTITPPTGPLRMGEVIVEDLVTGRFLAGCTNGSCQIGNFGGNPHLNPARND